MNEENKIEPGTLVLFIDLEDVGSIRAEGLEALANSMAELSGEVLTNDIMDEDELRVFVRSEIQKRVLELLRESSLTGSDLLTFALGTFENDFAKSLGKAVLKFSLDKFSGA